MIVAGQSNAGSNGVDATYGLTAVPAGWAVRWNGSQVANWLDTVGPNPYMLERAIAAGQTTGELVVRTYGSTKITNWRATYEGPMWADVYTRGIQATCDHFVWWQGESDAILEADALAYEAKLADWVDTIHAHLPNATVYVVEIPSTAHGYDDTIRAAEAAVCAARSWCVLIDTAGVALRADNVHATVDDGGGYDDVAGRWAAAWIP